MKFDEFSMWLHVGAVNAGAIIVLICIFNHPRVYAEHGVYLVRRAALDVSEKHTKAVAAAAAAIINNNYRLKWALSAIYPTRTD